MSSSTRYLLSLPPAAVRDFPALSESLERAWWAGGDPPGQPLGSAGGTVYLLREAWKAAGSPGEFSVWATSCPTIVVHGSGLSRRLLAYAPLGKPLIPMPVIRGSWGQRLDQTLLDLQSDTLDAVVEQSSHGAPLVITSGDVLLCLSRRRRPLPDADVVMFGMRTTPAVAKHFGVFVRRSRSEELDCMLQKPTEEELRSLGHGRNTSWMSASGS